jgi:hypothetical protein
MHNKHCKGEEKLKKSGRTKMDLLSTATEPINQTNADSNSTHSSTFVNTSSKDPPQETPATEGMSSGLSVALKAWQDINLTTLQKELDTQGLEIIDNQKDSLASRKKLAEQTKGSLLQNSTFFSSCIYI